MVVVVAHLLITTREGLLVKIFPLSLLLFTTVSLLSASVVAASHSPLVSPAPGVLCDTWFCADADGVSDVLTEEYRGKTKARHLEAQGEFDRTAFTFANGVHCDVKEKMCRKNRYYGADGKPSGAPDATTTRQLFGR